MLSSCRARSTISFCNSSSARTTSAVGATSFSARFNCARNVFPNAASSGLKARKSFWSRPLPLRLRARFVPRSQLQRRGFPVFAPRACFRNWRYRSGGSQLVRQAQLRARPLVGVALPDFRDAVARSRPPAANRSTSRVFLPPEFARLFHPFRQRFARLRIQRVRRALRSNRFRARLRVRRTLRFVARALPFLI